MRDAVRAEVPGLVGRGAVSEEVAGTLAATDATTIHRLLGWVPGPEVHPRPPEPAARAIW